ncbi:MAG: hypothetical protein H0T76_28875 [Nannocystis sp.]|nr:hypothetical protein [Nannocystis sp.]MBA3550508.1 hypothetical protein [Nannocystis sp.]
MAARARGRSLQLLDLQPRRLVDGHIVVNLRCLEDLDLDALPVERFDGKSD